MLTIIHFDIAKDENKSDKRFYEGLFHWKMENPTGRLLPGEVIITHSVLSKGGIIHRHDTVRSDRTGELFVHIPA